MKKKIGLILIIVVLAVGAGVFFLNPIKKSNDNIKSVVIKTAEKGSLRQTVFAEGNVEIKNEEDIYVSKAIRVDKVYFEENDTVKKGDMLISFYPEERNELKRNILLNELKIELEKLLIEENSFLVSNISIENAKRNIEEIKSNIIKLNEKIRIAKLEKTTLERELANRIEEYEINKKLFELEGVSFIEVNNSEEAKDTVMENIELKNWALKEYKLDLEEESKKLELANKNLLNTEKEYNEKRIIRKNDIKRSEIAIKQYEIEIDSLKEELEKTVEYVASPVSGTITEINAERNLLVDTDKSLMKISDIESQIIAANVSSYDINNVKLGQKVIITSDSFAEGEKLEGTLEKISSLATVESGSGYEDIVVEIEIGFDSKNSGLRPGYSTDLEIVIGQKENAVTVPTFAIITNKGKNFIMILNDDNTVSRKKIKIGMQTTTKTEILNLKGSEKIVINRKNIKDGEKVKVVDKITSKVSESRGSGRAGRP